MGDDNGNGICFLAGMTVGAVMMSFLVWIAVSGWWMSSAITHNAAHYDPNTGRFQWNE